MIAEASVTSFVEPSTPLGASSVHILEEMQKQRLTLDDGFGVIADDLDAVAEEFGFSLPDLDDSDADSVLNRSIVAAGARNVKETQFSVVPKTNTIWRSSWRGDPTTPHCALCGVEHLGGWGKAACHLQTMHAMDWTAIQATGGVKSPGLGCICGRICFTGGSAHRHRMVHATTGSSSIELFITTPGYDDHDVIRDPPRHSRYKNDLGITLYRCEIGNCNESFTRLDAIQSHQERDHFKRSYYCPLTAAHCPNAPCNRAPGGSGGPFLGRYALKSHLRDDNGTHRGHSGREITSGLDLSFKGLKAFEVR